MKRLLTITKLTTVAAVAAMVVASGGNAQADIWVGPASGEEFSTGTNWDTGSFTGTTQDLNGAFTVDRSVDSTAGRVFVSGGAVLNVTGGTHNSNISSASRYDFVGNSSVGTINQTAGQYSVGHGLRIGAGNASSDGTYNLTGGDLIVYRGSNAIVNDTGVRPSVEIGNLNGGSGLLEVSGGSLATRGSLHVYDTGVFSVVGSGVTSIGIGSNQSGDGGWLTTSGGTLKAAIDGGGVTPIFVDDVDATLGIISLFRSGSLLDLGFDGIAPVAGTWTLLEAENSAITDEGLALSGATASGWSFDVDNTGTNGLLTATYAVPEPTSLALFGLGGLCLVARRRK